MRYVVIGGVAALVHDLPVPATVDIDVTPDRDFDLADAAEEQSVLADDAIAFVVSVATWERLKAAAGRAKGLEHLDLFHEGDGGDS